MFLRPVNEGMNLKLSPGKPQMFTFVNVHKAYIWIYTSHVQNRKFISQKLKVNKLEPHAFRFGELCDRENCGYH